MTLMSVPKDNKTEDEVIAENLIDQRLGIATMESARDDQEAETSGTGEIVAASGSTQTKTGGYPRLERQIFVGGIPADVSPHSFRSWADQTFPGHVVNAVLVLDRETHTRSRGFGFVTFDNPEVAEMASQERLVSFGTRFVEIKRAQHLSSASRATNGDPARQPNVSHLPASPPKTKNGGLAPQQHFKTEKQGPTLYSEQHGGIGGRRHLNRTWAAGMSDNWKQDQGPSMLRAQRGHQKHNYGGPGPKPHPLRNTSNMPQRGGPHNCPPNVAMNPGPAGPANDPAMSISSPTTRGAAFSGRGAQISDETGHWPGPPWGYMELMAVPPDQGGPVSMGPVPFPMHPGMAMAWPGPSQWAVPGMPPGWVPMPMPMGFVASPNMMPGPPPGMVGFGQAGAFNPAMAHMMMMGGYGMDQDQIEEEMSALSLQNEVREPAGSDAERQEGGVAVVAGPDLDANEGPARAQGQVERPPEEPGNVRHPVLVAQDEEGRGDGCGEVMDATVTSNSEEGGPEGRQE